MLPPFCCFSPCVLGHLLSHRIGRDQGRTKRTRGQPRSVRGRLRDDQVRVTARRRHPRRLVRAADGRAARYHIRSRHRLGQDRRRPHRSRCAAARAGVRRADVRSPNSRQLQRRQDLRRLARAIRRSGRLRLSAVPWHRFRRHRRTRHVDGRGHRRAGRRRRARDRGVDLGQPVCESIGADRAGDGPQRSVSGVVRAIVRARGRHLRGPGLRHQHRRPGA